MTADNRPGLDRRVGRVVAIAGATLIAGVATLTGWGAPSAEAALLAASQTGNTRFSPDKRSPVALDCSVVGFQIPPSREGSVDADIRGQVHLSVNLVGSDGSVLRDVTASLADSEQTYNLLNLEGEVIGPTNSTPKAKPDFGFVGDLSEDPYKGPIGRGTFNAGQVRATLEEIKRFEEHKDGPGSYPFRDFVNIVRSTSRGLKTYRNDCGVGEVIRRYTKVLPRYLYLGKHYYAGPEIEIADDCETDVVLTRRYKVMTPPEQSTQPPPPETRQEPPAPPVQAPYQAPKPRTTSR